MQFINYQLNPLCHSTGPCLMFKLQLHRGCSTLSAYCSVRSTLFKCFSLTGPYCMKQLFTICISMTPARTAGWRLELWCRRLSCHLLKSGSMSLFHFESLLPHLFLNIGYYTLLSHLYLLISKCITSKSSHWNLLQYMNSWET